MRMSRCLGPLSSPSICSLGFPTTIAVLNFQGASGTPTSGSQACYTNHSNEFSRIVQYLHIVLLCHIISLHVSDIPPRISKHYKKEKIRYWNVNLPQTLSQPMMPGNRPSGEKYPPGYPPILREFPTDTDEDYNEHKYLPRPESNPDPPKPRDFDPRPWIEQPRPKPDEDRENFNPYDNFGTRPQFESSETILSEVDTVKSSSISTILIVLGVVFLLINLFAFVFIFYQKNRLNMRVALFNNARMRHFQCASRNPCDGDADEYEFTDDEVESQIYMKKTAATTSPTDVKSILKNNNSDYEAVSTNKQTFAERKNSTSTVDTNMKVRQWIVEKCEGTQFEMDGSSDEMGSKTLKASSAGSGGKTKDDVKQKGNIYVDRKERRNVKKESDYDVIKSRRKISDDSSSTKKPVKKVSVAVDATPAARTASVLRQIPIEITKSSKSLNEISKDESEIPLVLRKNKSFDYPDDEFVDEKSKTLPSNFNKKRSMSTTSIHELKQLIDSNKTFQEIALIRDKSALKNKSTKTVHKNEATILDDGSKHNSKTNGSSGDINVTSRNENQTIVPLTHQQMMNGIKRRNFPKVLPEYPQNSEGISTSNMLPPIPMDVRRLSLPPNSFDLCSNDTLSSPGGGVPKIPPLPPPRVSSTLGRKPQQPLHKSQVFIQLNKNQNTIPETIDENCVESVQTGSGNEKSIEDAIDKILKSQPKLTKQNSVDLESTINQVKGNLEAIENTTRMIEVPNPKTTSAKNESKGVSNNIRSSNSFESAIKKQQNKILNKGTSDSSSGEGPTKQYKVANEIKDKSPETINLSQENVFYETVFHDSSVVPNSIPETKSNTNDIEIPFVHKQQNKTPEEIYKSLKIIRLEKEKLQNANPIPASSTKNSSVVPTVSNPSLPINDKTSTYAIIRNTNQNPELLNPQQKHAKVSKEPKYIIKPQISQITSSSQHADKKIPHTVVPNTPPPDLPSTGPRTIHRNKDTIHGVQSNVMIGTQPNISGVQSSKVIPTKDRVQTNFKVPYSSHNSTPTDTVSNNTPSSLGNSGTAIPPNGSSSNNTSKSNTSIPCSNTATTNSKVPSNVSHTMLPTKENTPRVTHKSNDVTNSDKIAANKSSTSTETLSSDKSCSSSQSSKNNHATASGMSTIKKKKKS